MNIRCALLVTLFPLLASAASKPAEPAPDSSAAATPAAVPNRSAKSSAHSSVLGKGDTVGFQIVEDKEPIREVRVSDTGDLEVPYIGRVHVAGKTCDDAAAEIKKRLEKDYYHQATVRLAINEIYKSGLSGGPPVIATATVSVAGDQSALRGAGPQTFPKTEKLTISAAILKAGPTIYANQAKVKLTRTTGGATETKVINVERILKEGRRDEDIELKDGDYIFVPKKPIVI